MSLKNICFDGRKDTTSTNDTIGETKYRRITCKEEHISVLSEPNSQYISHFVPVSGSAKKHL